jgi:hypothetical protein
MVMEGLRMLSSEGQHDTLTDEECAILKQACATLKQPRSVTGPRSSAGKEGPHDPVPRPSEADLGSRRVAPPKEEEVRMIGFLNLGHAPLTFTIEHFVAGNGRRSNAQGLRREATPGLDVPDENGTSWVQEDGRGGRAEATSSQATSDLRFCEICSRCLNGDEKHKHHMKLHRFKNGLR